jgi:hypothetical protein
LTHEVHHILEFLLIRLADGAKFTVGIETMLRLLAFAEAVMNQFRTIYDRILGNHDAIRGLAFAGICIWVPVEWSRILTQTTEIVNAQSPEELSVSATSIDDVQATLLDTRQTFGDSKKHTHERRVQSGTVFQINDKPSPTFRNLRFNILHHVSAVLFRARAFYTQPHHVATMASDDGSRRVCYHGDKI